MRRYDKKKHMKKVNLLFEYRNILETISPSLAYRDKDAMMTVLTNKRRSILKELIGLGLPMIEAIYYRREVMFSGYKLPNGI